MPPLTDDEEEDDEDDEGTTGDQDSANIPQPEGIAYDVEHVFMENGKTVRPCDVIIHINPTKY